VKRLTFKPEFVPDILAEKKRHTSRWRDQKLKVGDRAAAVTGQNGKPAFLVPARDGFATLEITSVEGIFWKDFTEEDAADCGVTRDWYLKEKPDASPDDLIYKYGWKLLDWGVTE
jgi:hypothetical protein